ncbi:hypothetical protein HMPREF9701_05503 [Delftia acidovorans CCUG 274B]|jgi:antitoxin component HigA of HigAB toxin-antitoxin module|uniref:helix-turn-helix domain-containing protein n=1 Tax=Delftia acidovorans TaxID=80866 RepID=UPI000353A5D6|nr:helix-turn-helix transcriptional regulator [Delftia acidovorans]EPD35124.1 hypothetical protein HMPREF9701_05503 [Delftia acidovorans CCUG 274B]
MAKLTNNVNSRLDNRSTLPVAAFGEKEILEILASDFDDDELFDIKKDQIATDLICLMAQAGLNRSELSSSLGLPKSRVTKLLSGKENLTIKTIFLFSRKLGFDFDVIFRHSSEQRTLQPWAAGEVSSATRHFIKSRFDCQTANQVLGDLRNGSNATHYLRYKDPDNERLNASVNANPASQKLFMPNNAMVGSLVFFNNESELKNEQPA